MLKPKDGNGFEVNDWGTDMAEDANSITAPVPPPLTDLPAAERRHPLFRQGYNLGYAHRAQEEALADQKRHSPPSFQAERTRPPRSYNVTVGGLLGRLSPGVRTDRDLIAITDSAFTCETPCCGREITVPIFQEEDQPQPAACCRCAVIYQVHLIQEDPDGFSDEPPPCVAVFIVEHLDVAVARHRAGRWEQTLRASQRFPKGRSTGGQT